MKLILLVFQNIRTIWKKEKIVLFLFVLGVMIATITILYSFGQAFSLVNYVYKKPSFILTYNNEIMFKELQKSIESSTREIPEIDNIKVFLYDDPYSQKSMFATYRHWDYAIQYGTDFDESDEPQIIIGTVSGEYADIGNFLQINNVNYKVVGKRIYQFFNQVNYTSLSDDTEVCKLEIMLTDQFSQHKIHKISDKLTPYFENASISEPQAVNYISSFLNNKYFYIAISLSLMSIITLLRLYQYLLKTRRNTYAIIQICGSNIKQGFMLFFIELEILSLPAYIIGVIVFKVFIEAAIRNEFFYNIQLSNGNIIFITIVFIALQALVFFPIMKKYSRYTPKQLKYNGE